MLRRLSVANYSIAGALALIALLAGGPAHADSDDPPARVAHVNLIDGNAQLKLAGTDNWVDQLVNRPLTGGDRLWVESGSRAEMHIGSTALRLGSGTALQILSVDDGQIRLRVTTGSLSIRIRDLDSDERFEIETPQGLVSLLQPGGYRVDVDDRDERTYLAVWSGHAEVSNRSGAQLVRSDESAELAADNDSPIRIAQAGATDSLDLWAEDRDRREEDSRAARYVSREVVGYEELDGYGDWEVDPDYGSIWVPQLVMVDWAPYRYGYWSWIGPWGWTWIDNEPWGFAPCHYGRWVHARHGWAWSPGMREIHHPVFAPALVAWRGGMRPDADVRHAPRVGWVPLGYNEVYEPPFHASRNYLRAANVSNTHLGRENVERYIDRRQGGDATRVQRRYANESVPGAYSEVSRETFTAAQPVARNLLRTEPGATHQTPFSTSALEIRPEPRSVGRSLPADRTVTRSDRPIAERPSAAPAYPQGQRGADRAPAADYGSQRRYSPPAGTVRESPQEIPRAQAPATREVPPVREGPPMRERPPVREAPPVREMHSVREVPRDVPRDMPRDVPRMVSPVRESPPVRQAPPEHQSAPVHSAPAPAPESHGQREPDRHADHGNRD